MPRTGTAAPLAGEEPGSAVSSAQIPGGPPASQRDEVLRWTYYAQEALRRSIGGIPPPMGRALAMTFGSIYDAVNSITPIGAPYLGTVPAPPCSSNQRQCVDSAVNEAAASALAAALPALDSYVREARNAERERIGEGRAANIGREVGRAAARQMIQARANDGSDNTTPYVPDGTTGSWRPISNCQPGAPNWATTTPFTMVSPTQFRPDRPGGFTTYADLLASPLYAEQVNEVQSLGRHDSVTRTAEQTEIANFWANDLDGTYHPPGQHIEHTRVVSETRRLNVGQNARLFGLLGLAIGDASVVAWDSKYGTTMDLWRPITAIQLADTDNNPATTADPTWEPLLLNRQGQRVTPCFPSYTSGHATFAGVWATIMKGFFGTDNITFTGGTDDPNAPGVVRTFTSFSSASLEDARSRIYLGVHYQFDADAGYASGQQLGEFILSTRLQAR